MLYNHALSIYWSVCLSVCLSLSLSLSLYLSPSLPPFPTNPFRLTAYVAKVFAMASDIISIQENVICDALKWLVLNSQQPDGIFKETFNVYHAEMVVWDTQWELLWKRNDVL